MKRILKLSKINTYINYTLLICILSFLGIVNLNGQEKFKVKDDYKILDDFKVDEDVLCVKTYSLDRNREILLTGLGVGLNLIGYSLDHDGATLAGLRSLNQENLWSVDRSPLMIYADQKCRSEGLTIGLMGL